MGLAVNEGKIKYMFSTSRDVGRIYSRIESRNLFILTPPLPPKMMSVWRSNVCMGSSTTLTLCSVLIFSNCAGSAISLVWRKMLRRDGYLMRGSAEVGEEDDLVSVGRTKPSKYCHRLV